MRSLRITYTDGLIFMRVAVYKNGDAAATDFVVIRRTLQCVVGC
jgi:hypothetical protein